MKKNLIFERMFSGKLESSGTIRRKLTWDDDDVDNDDDKNDDEGKNGYPTKQWACNPWLTHSSGWDQDGTSRPAQSLIMVMIIQVVRMIIEDDDDHGDEYGDHDDN